MNHLDTIKAGIFGFVVGDALGVPVEFTSRAERHADPVTDMREYGTHFELKVECIKKKKTISYCRRRMNRGLVINTSRMQSEIDEEMKLYYTRLRDLADETESAKKARTLSDFSLCRAKKIYHRLTKILHPDINKKTAEHEDYEQYLESLTRALDDINYPI